VTLMLVLPAPVFGSFVTVSTTLTLVELTPKQMSVVMLLPVEEANSTHDVLASGQGATTDATHAGKSPQLTVPPAPPRPPVPGVPPVAPVVPPVAPVVPPVAAAPPVPPVPPDELLPHAARPTLSVSAHPIDTAHPKGRRVIVIRLSEET
jgi:hypothetical protein